MINSTNSLGGESLTALVITTKKKVKGIKKKNTLRNR